MKEVLPTVTEHRGNVSQLLLKRTLNNSLFTMLSNSFLNIDECGLQLDVIVEKLKEQLDAKQKESAAWKAKYNIKTQEEVEAAKRQ